MSTYAEFRDKVWLRNCVQYSFDGLESLCSLNEVLVLYFTSSLHQSLSVLHIAIMGDNIPCLFPYLRSCQGSRPQVTQQYSSWQCKNMPTMHPLGVFLVCTFLKFI